MGGWISSVVHPKQGWLIAIERMANGWGMCASADVAGIDIDVSARKITRPDPRRLVSDPQLQPDPNIVRFQ